MIRRFCDKIRDMFSVFREWWLIKQLKIFCRKGDRHFLAAKEVNSFFYMDKEVFLFGVSRYFFSVRRQYQKRVGDKWESKPRWWVLPIPRPHFWHLWRVSKDRKILEKSKRRNPPLIEEKSYYEEANDTTRSPFLRSITPIRERKHNVFEITTTGDGDNFTFGVALAEFLNSYWSLLFVIPAAVIASPFFIVVRDWAIKITSPYSPFW